MGRTKLKNVISNRYYSRRQFLMGMGGSMLMLPPLLSLMTPAQAAAQAGASTKRVILIATNYGIDPAHFFPKITGQTQVAGTPDFWYTPLTSAPQNMSTALGAAWNDPVLRSKLNLYEGLDACSTVYYGGHSHGLFSGSYEAHPNATETRDTRYGKSIDIYLSQSPNVYKKTMPIPVMRICSSGRNDDNWSFDRVGDGMPIYQGASQGDKALFNKAFGNLSTAPAGTVSPADQDRLFVMDKVLPDLQSLMNHRRLSSADKQLLDRFTTGVHETQKKVQANSTALACSKPNITIQATKAANYYYFVENAGVKSCNAMLENYHTIIRNSFMCDLTRIVVYGNSLWSDDPHGWQVSNDGLHQHEDPKLSAQRHSWFMDRIAHLAKTLNDTPDPLSPTGSLLDNCIIFHTNEHANLGHHIRSLPIMTIGSNGGYFKTGFYIDARQRPYTKDPYKDSVGRPYKQLLISIMESMGMQRSEYINTGKDGFGSFYNESNWYSKYVSTHNDPLPFIKA